MNDDVVRCGLYANDLTRLRRPRPSGGEYALVEVLADGLASRLAAAMGVQECEVLDRLERGCRAFAACNRTQEVVSWLWVSTGQEWAPPLRRTFRFTEGDCYGWNAGTLEHHRGRGLFTRLLEHAGWRMAREGCHTMWNGIIDDNLPSQRAHARAGFRPVLRLVAHHEPPPTRLLAGPAESADEALVARARRLLGDEPLPITGSRSRADVSDRTRERARELARTTTEHTTTGQPQPDGHLAAALRRNHA